MFLVLAVWYVYFCVLRLWKDKERSHASTGQRYLSCACSLPVVVSVASAIFALLFGRLQFLCCDLSLTRISHVLVLALSSLLAKTVTQLAVSAVRKSRASLWSSRRSLILIGCDLLSLPR